MTADGNPAYAFDVRIGTIGKLGDGSMSSGGSADVRMRGFQKRAEVAQLEKSLYAFPWSLGNFRDSVNAGYDCWSVTHGERVIGYAILMIALGI